MVVLTVLGSGSCVPSFRRSSPAYHVSWSGGSLFVDLGSGALRRAVEAGLDWRTVDALLVTHFHMDHIADVPALLFAFKNTPGLHRSRELVLCGPVGIVDMISDLAHIFGKWVKDPGVPLQLVECDGLDIGIRGCRVSARRVKHSRGALGYRLEVEGITLVFSGDTGVCDELVWLARDADLAVFECAATDRPVSTHLTPEEAGQVASEAHVRRLVLSHFYPSAEAPDVLARCRETYKGPLMLAEDLQRFAFSGVESDSE